MVKKCVHSTLYTDPGGRHGHTFAAAAAVVVAVVVMVAVKQGGGGVELPPRAGNSSSCSVEQTHQEKGHLPQP